MSERRGQCLCGQVRYRVSGEPVVSRICWCRDCQRFSSNGTANAIFPAAAIEISGDVSDHVAIADSGNQVRRRFCARCGSHLFAESSGRVGFTVLRLGTLDDPSSVTPSVNIWCGSAPRWACIDGSLTRFEGAPPALPPASSR